MISQDKPLIISTQRELQPYAPPVDVIEPREIIQNLWGRKLKILSIVAMLMLLTVIVLSMITPRYTAETLVMIDSSRRNIINFDSVLPGLSIDKETIASEIEILKSQDLAKKVVNHLNLYADPEFNVALRPKSRLAETLQAKKFIPDALLNILDENFNEASEGEGESIEKALTVAAFMEGMSVFRKGDARIIKISYTSISAKKAADLTNAIADVYIIEQLTARLEATQNATRWLNERVAPLRDKVRQSEVAITQFKQSSGLTESKGTTLNAQQMAELSSQLIIAQTDYAEAQARMRHVNRLIKRSGVVDSIPEVLESALIQALRIQEAELQGKILSTELGERHPTMIQLRAELKDLRTKINLEATKIVNGIRIEAEIAGVRKTTLQNNLNKLKDLDAENNNARVELQALEREAEADRKLLEVLLSRLSETASQNNIDNFQPDARVVSYGSIPISPSYPKKAPILVLMLFGSVLIAILFLSLSGPSNQVFRSCKEIEMQTGLPSLGFLPNIRPRWPEKIVVKKPESAFAESVRTLYSSALLAFAGSKIKTLLITSTESGEGNTTIAACLAKTRAIAGDKTLVVDLNLRDPNIHSIFGVEKLPGITELLSGDCPLEEVIRIDPETGAHIITVGAACLNPADILMGNNVEALIPILHELYDLVIIDSPPIMAVPDARLLLDKVDATLFVVRWAQTKRKFVQKALAEATASRNQLIGVVLNMVDEKKHT